jgi:uncharacterized Zn-finger protein
MDAPQKPSTETVNSETHVKSRVVSCDGGDGAYGHPQVYLRIIGTQITCPYCSRVFILQGGGADSAH